MGFKPVLKRFAILRLHNEFIKFLLDCIYNFVHGNVSFVHGNVSLAQNTFNESKFKKFKIILTFVCNKKVKFSQKQNFLATNQGLQLIKIIYEPVQNHFKDEQAN